MQKSNAWSQKGRDDGSSDRMLKLSFILNTDDYAAPLIVLETNDHISTNN